MRFLRKRGRQDFSPLLRLIMSTITSFRREQKKVGIPKRVKIIKRQTHEG